VTSMGASRSWTIAMHASALSDESTSSREDSGGRANT